jgi:hypothetical protein
MNAFAFPLVVIAYSGAAAGWTITALLTFLLIGPPVLYALALTFASDPDAIDRAVHDVERRLEATNRAFGHAREKDVYDVLEQPQAPTRRGAGEAQGYRQPSASLAARASR